MSEDTDDAEMHQIELTHGELLKVRISLINSAKEWEDQGDPETAQSFRDILGRFAFDSTESQNRETVTIEVSKRVYERFEEMRKQTENVHVPPVDQETYLSSLLDTVDAFKEGHYDE